MLRPHEKLRKKEARDSWYQSRSSIGTSLDTMVKHGATKGASGSNPSEEVTQRRGREEHIDPDAPRRERSKDMISAFDSRLSQVEEGVSGMEAQVDDLSQRVDGLEAEDAAIHTAIKGMLA